MTNEETKTEEISEVTKSEDTTSVTSILASLVKAQEKRLDSQEEIFGKKFDELALLIKEKNANPVDGGIETENKPKKEDANDVGDKVTVGNEYAPSPGDQASIIAPALEPSKTDTEGLKMENKADGEEKKEEVKEKVKEEVKDEVTKMDEHDEKKDEKEDVKKSDSEYEIVKTVRPKVYQREEVSSIPTGYQVLKAIASGFGGKTSSIEESMVIAYNKLEDGEFGNGLPGVY